MIKHGFQMFACRLDHYECSCRSHENISGIDKQKNVYTFQHGPPSEISLLNVIRTIQTIVTSRFDWTATNSLKIFCALLCNFLEPQLFRKSSQISQNSMFSSLNSVRRNSRNKCIPADEIDSPHENMWMDWISMIGSTKRRKEKKTTQDWFE